MKGKLIRCILLHNRGNLGSMGDISWISTWPYSEVEKNMLKRSYSIYVIFMKNENRQKKFFK